MTRFQVFSVLVIAIFLGLALDASAVSVKETVLYNFNCGATLSCEPMGALARDAAGNLYGTTNDGGDSTCGNGGGCGTVFELSLNGTGGWTETVLHAFGGGSDGAFPRAGLVLDAKGNLYGTTFQGGGSNACNLGCGTIFELTLTAGMWTESILYAFTGQADGANPAAGLVFDRNGNLYGTAFGGGASTTCGGGGCGVVFQFRQVAGRWEETVLYNFTNPGPANPVNGVVLDYLGDLYGNGQGGVYGGGAVFRLIPSTNGWTEQTIWSFGIGAYGCSPNGVSVYKNALFGTAGCGAYGVGTVFELTPAIGNWNMQVIHAFTGGNDGGEPLAGLTSGQNYLYGTTAFGGYYQQGTVFALAPSGNNGEWTETVVYNFTGVSDGLNPYNPLLLTPGSLTGYANGRTDQLVFQIAPN